MTDQLDLFGIRPQTTVTPGVLREEARFGKWDARCGLPLDNDYRAALVGERLAEYERAFREERRRG